MAEEDEVPLLIAAEIMGLGPGGAAKLGLRCSMSCCFRVDLNGTSSAVGIVMTTGVIGFE